MRLKRLTLHGFKSFAERTEIDFDAGITGIVGPNGCGKSNVVDAFKWVLGEQSAKSLRGKQMLDVIFNGSSSRKSSGMAEVTLTFKAEGAFKEQYGEEIVVTRRLYRSGQSEYLLNKKSSRLKDIREMFMDTGCGVDAYSLIEQGKVDLLLQASNQERRAVLEEAAGISKYKTRRKEAQRRLDNVQQNLLRLGDIVGEVEKRLRSVKLQAGKARNYQQYEAELREMKSEFYLADYHQMMDKQASLRVELDEVNVNLRDARVEQDVSESDRSELELAVVEFGNKIATVENHLTQTIAQINSANDNIENAHQRIDEQTDSLNHARRRLQTYHSQVDTLRKQQKQLEIELESFSGQGQDFSSQIEELQQQLNEKAMDLAELNEDVEMDKSQLIELMRQIAAANNQINQASLQYQNILDNRERLESRQEQLSSQRSEVEIRQSGLRHEYEEIEENLEASQTRLTDVQKEYEELHVKADELTKDLADSREKRSALRSRRDVLSDMENKQQGLDKGVKALLKRKEESPEEFAGLETFVADIIKTDLEYAKLIETSLSGRDQYLILEQTDFVQKHSEFLNALTSQVNFLALDLLSPMQNVSDYKGQDGVIGLAANFVRCDAKYDNLIKVLLGKTVLVNDLATAIRLRREDSEGMRFVTLDGQIVEADGGLHFGVGKGTSGLISRKSELETLETQLAQLDQQVVELEQKSKETHDKQRELAESQQQLRTKIYEFKTALVQSETHLSNCDEQLRKLEQEAPIIASELESLEQQENFAIQQQDQAEQSLVELESEQTQTQYRLEAKQGQLQSRRVDKNKFADQLTELKIQAGQITEKRRAAVNAINSLKQRSQQIMASYASAESEIQSALTRRQQAERQILSLESRLAQGYLDKQEAQMESAWLRQKRDVKQQALSALLESTSDVRELVSRLQQRSQDLAIKINELTVRQETLIQRVQEELDIDVEHSYSGYEYEEKDWDAIEQQIGELKGKIQRLGNVNIDAIAEQDDLETREKFLTGQQKDLFEAQEKLQDLITKLDDECARRFKETFDTVRANFQELFRKIFGGGKADMVLDNPEDVLESGIDIQARPPGKETRSVTLLSGGEKTMTTVSLLMAIFKSKPSPFCILDEVDAALDEANVDRYNLVIQEFLAHSQFIVITHNKRTMSYANALYGITMQEAGVSRRVAVKFDDVSGSPKSPDDEGHEAA